MNPAAAKRIPPIQCLLTFEALARLRSVTQAAEELFVTPSAVSHRVKQLEQIIGTKLYGRADFSLTTEGSEYLAHVREGLATLQKFPGAAGQSANPGKRKLRLAVTPTFSRSILIPRLRQFTVVGIFAVDRHGDADCFPLAVMDPQQKTRAGCRAKLSA